MTMSSADGTAISLTTAVPALEARRVVQVYRRAPIVVTHGRGVYLYDSEGHEYIDFISGVGVASLGHANPELARVVAEQAQVLLHCSNLFFHPYQGELAERLASMSGLDRTFFCNSGTEAMEACLKFARRYWYTAGEVERTGIVALQGAFHGRTMGSLSITADPHYRDPFAPLLADVTFVSPDDAGALAQIVTAKTAAVVMEGIQGEGGVRPIAPEFATAVREACDRTGALLVCDEVQCGLGRTGHPFYYPVLGLRPHLVAIGKALGAGIPIGAALVSEQVARRLEFGDHGSTYGGNLLACRAGLFFIGRLLDGGVLDHVARVGKHFEARLLELARAHAIVREVRGCGLMRGIDLDRPAAPVVDAARAEGLLVNGTARTVVRMLPPLTVTEAEIDRALERLDAALTQAAGASAT
ncbi:MAG TPA: acetylornithine/succinylornithine family transaminase [Vicinamibacterales bacterium]|nr:acetylornithine/succinylornithine family transaminase [Vicinamibacterales bacterium]